MEPSSNPPPVQAPHQASDPNVAGRSSSNVEPRRGATRQNGRQTTSLNFDAAAADDWQSVTSCMCPDECRQGTRFAPSPASSKPTRSTTWLPSVGSPRETPEGQTSSAASGRSAAWPRMTDRHFAAGNALDTERAFRTGDKADHRQHHHCERLDFSCERNNNNGNCDHNVVDPKTGRHRCRRAADNLYVDCPLASSSSSSKDWHALAVEPRLVTFHSASALSSQSPVWPAETMTPVLPKTWKTPVTTSDGGRDRSSVEFDNVWNAGRAFDRQVASRDGDNRFKIVDIGDDMGGRLGDRPARATQNSSRTALPTSSKKPGTVKSSSSSLSTATADAAAAGNVTEDQCQTVVCPRCGRCRCDRCRCPSPRSRRRRRLPSIWCGPRCGLWTLLRVIECISCVCLVQAVDYHCSSASGDGGGRSTPLSRGTGSTEMKITEKFNNDDSDDDDVDDAESPCSCRRSTAGDRSSCRRRWACIVGLAFVGCLPCLLLYWPLRAIAAVVRMLYAVCSALVRRQRGCRCRQTSVVVTVFDVDGSGIMADRTITPMPRLLPVAAMTTKAVSAQQ